MVYAGVSHHLCSTGATHCEQQSNLRWLLLVLGLEVPRQSQTVIHSWLLLVPGLDYLARGMGVRGSLRLALARLIGFREL